MDFLEREGALAELAAARDAAARGRGRVVFVVGEPGIGKTSLVSRFVQGLGAGERVLLGTCDDLSIPRPLGPVRDLAGSVSPPLAEALAAGAAPHEIQTLLVAELELPPRPTVLVLEDVHWADDATFDAITVLGRRIGSLPALLVLTLRAGEAPPGHPLHAAIGAIRADDSVVLELAPLSAAAVASLAGDEADEVYAATGGNPFYVTELLASRTGVHPPASIANAVVGRASRLDPEERRLVELVSVVPGRVPASLLDAVMPGWAAAAEDPERRQLLEVDHTHVRFRHELARNAILAGIPIAARRRLHGAILDGLLAADADPADIVHHAEAAGAQDVVAEYALVAARRAAALDSNREAFSHYRRAADFLDRMTPREQASFCEELVTAAYVVGRLDEAFSAVERSIAIYRTLGDEEALGRCTRVQSRLHWFDGDGALARARANEAVAILEPLGESVELARAYSGLSQLAMLAEDSRQAIDWGEKALELALRLGDDATHRHALVNIGTAGLQLHPGAAAALLDAFAIADAAGDREEAVRALANLAMSLFWWARPEESLAHAERALAYARDHEVHHLASYTASTVAWLQLRAGEWDEAERTVRRELERGIPVSQLLARTVLAELAARRGDLDAPRQLAELWARAERTGDLQRIVPVLEIDTQAALVVGAPQPTARIEATIEQIHQAGAGVGWMGARVASCAAFAGIEMQVGPPMPVPQAAMLARDWRGAADAFGAVGWDYDRAVMLSLLDDEDALVEAIEIARGLGAEPLMRRVTGRMRERSLRVPQGPREATRANPAGLTARQLEVLALLVDGLTNAEIADRLIVSPRTAEHHVAAVLAKLGATTRREAARRAAELRVELPT
jgi:predicted ATPase/DNA-binding CsgD family transcriptional regulator